MTKHGHDSRGVCAGHFEQTKPNQLTGLKEILKLRRPFSILLPDELEDGLLLRAPNSNPSKSHTCILQPLGPSHARVRIPIPHPMAPNGYPRRTHVCAKGN